MAGQRCAAHIGKSYDADILLWEQGHAGRKAIEIAAMRDATHPAIKIRPPAKAIKATAQLRRLGLPASRNKRCPHGLALRYRNQPLATILAPAKLQFHPRQKLSD